MATVGECCVFCSKYGATCLLFVEHQLFTIDERTFDCRIVMAKHTYGDTDFFGQIQHTFWFHAADMHSFLSHEQQVSATVDLRSTLQDAVDRIDYQTLMQRHSACDTSRATGTFSPDTLFLTPSGVHKLGSLLRADRLVEWINKTVLRTITSRRLHAFAVGDGE